MKRRKKLLPGTEFKIAHLERDGAEQKKVSRTYTIIKEYPHFILSEYRVNGNRIRECFTRQEVENALQVH